MTDKFYVNGCQYAVYVRPYKRTERDLYDEYSVYTDSHNEYVTYRFDYVDDMTNLELSDDVLATFTILAHDAGIDMSIVDCYHIFDESGWCEGVEGIEQPDENGDRFMDGCWHCAESESSMIATCKILKKRGI